MWIIQHINVTYVPFSIETRLQVQGKIWIQLSTRWEVLKLPALYIFIGNLKLQWLQDHPKPSTVLFLWDCANWIPDFCFWLKWYSVRISAVVVHQPEDLMFCLFWNAFLLNKEWLYGLLYTVVPESIWCFYPQLTWCFLVFILRRWYVWKFQEITSYRSTQTSPSDTSNHATV